jgi:hypothetical protein
MLELTVFDNIYDNKTNKRMRFAEWQDLESLLYKLSKRETFKPSKEKFEKGGAKLISPAAYAPGTTRANKNVLRWDWACIDVDDYEGTFDDIIQNFGDYYYVCYSTGSSTVIHPKFRLVFPLETSVKSEKIPHFWHALNKEFLDIGDAQTKDMARMFYIPGQYPNANNFIFTHDGPFINPIELMKKHPYHERSRSANFFDRLPPDVQAQLLEKKKSQMTADITWSNYNDCPFVNKRLVTEYKSITGSGWYHTMYRLLCSIASNAIRSNYPITAQEIAQLARELDSETGNWYANRPLEIEADRALEWAYKNSI